jgi:type IV secretory pathway VirB4 component
MWEEAYQVLNPGSILLKSIAWMAGAGALSFLGSAAIPSVLNQMLPPAAQDELWTFLPFSKVAPDRKTLICKDRHIRVLELQGAELTLASDMAHEILFDERKRFFDSLEQHGIEHVKIVTLKQEIGLTRQLRASNPVVRAMDITWEKNFPTPTKLSHYLIIVAKGKTLAETQTPLDAAEGFALTTLNQYVPKVLTEPESIDPDDFEDEETRPHGPLKPFAQVLSPIHPHSPLAMNNKGPLAALLTTNTIDFSRIRSGIMTFAHGSERRYASILTWRDCGDRSSEAIMRELTAIDCEIVIYHAVQPISTTAAIVDLNKDKKSALTQHLSHNAEHAYDEVLKAVEGLVADEKAGLVYYAMHVIPIAKTEKHLDKVVREITRIMSRSTGTAIPLRTMAQPTYLSMVDSEQAWPRKFRFMTPNVAANVYLQRTTKSHLKSDWCDEPLAWLRTLSGDPYPMHFHVDDKKEAVGHTLVIGATGAGKTTLMTFLAASAMRVPRLRVYLFDRLYGMKVFTTCAGGQYLDFDNAHDTAIFNPLHMPDSGPTRSFLLSWLQEITGQTDATAKAEFSRMIGLIYDRKGFPKEARSLKMVANACFSPTGTARAALEPWIDDSQYGQIFNADEEAMNLHNGRLTAFNMSKVLNDPSLAPAVVSYLVHRVQSLSMDTKDPSLLFIDESGPMMANDLFARNFLRVGLQEGRKLRQVYILCFQSPGSLMNTGNISQTILDQCHRQILFRVGRANSEDALAQYAAFGLNQAELDFIGRKTFKEFPYGVLIRNTITGASAVVDADLSPMRNFMRMFKSGTESVGEIEALLGVLPRDQAIKTYLGI